MLAPNTILKNRYRILQQLGQGGMGAVYQAIDENLNRMVAVKETFATDQEWRLAFRREAELLANLRHQALPKAIEHFSEGDSDFFVMELIPGRDLHELLTERGSPFPESQVLRWADEILSVLGYLHSKDLVHRDIKPSNIKLTSEGELSLLDFGLAKGSAGQMPTIATVPKSMPGYTLAFAPLEQILGGGTDASSDLYSVGATLYNLLTGKTPVNASDRYEVMDDGGEDPLPFIQHMNPHVSTETAGIIQSAMALKRRHRPASAVDMRNALRGAFNEIKPTEPAKPRPEPKPTQPPEPRPQPIKPTEPYKPPTPPQPTMTAQAPVTPSPWNSRIFDPTDRPPVEPVREPAKWNLTPAKVRGVIGLVVLVFIVLSGVVWAVKGILGSGDKGPDNKPTLSATTATPSPSMSPSPKPSPSFMAGDTMQNGVGIEFSFIPPGTFIMGSNMFGDEEPIHRVTFKYGFFMGKYEITQGMWEAITANDPSRYRDCGPRCPVETVSWNSIQDFIYTLNRAQDGYHYRLPTEAEWEYAARAGETGDSPAQALSSVAWVGAWYLDASGQRVYGPDFQPKHQVGLKQPNAFGLYDMLGNVPEWCEDYYHSSYLGSPVNGKARTDPELGERILRGGSSLRNSDEVRFAKRFKALPDTGGNPFGNWFEGYGFRLVAVPRKL